MPPPLIAVGERIEVADGHGKNGLGVEEFANAQRSNKTGSADAPPVTLPESGRTTYEATANLRVTMKIHPG